MKDQEDYLRSVESANKQAGRCVTPEPTMRERLIAKLFPRPFPEHMSHGASFIAREYITSNTVTHWSFSDRIRILLTGRTVTRLEILGENVIGESATNSAAYVLPPKWLEGK